MATSMLRAPRRLTASAVAAAIAPAPARRLADARPALLAATNAAVSTVGRLSGYGRACSSGSSGSGSSSGSTVPIRYAFVDIDGTLASAGQAITGAQEALNRLRAGTRGLRLLTNQSQETPAATLDRLQLHGFHVGLPDIFGTLTAVRRLVDQKQLRPIFLLTDGAREAFEGVPTHEPNAVVIGTAPQHFHYERLNEAMRALLHEEGSELIACNKGRYFQGPDGLMLQAGPFVSALEFATSRQATVVGKPSRDFFHAAVRDVVGAVEGDRGILPELASCVMIGDDAMDDVQGAMDAGMQAILVRTGKYRSNDEARCRQRPLAVVDSVAEAVDFLHSEGLLAGA